MADEAECLALPKIKASKRQTLLDDAGVEAKLRRELKRLQQKTQRGYELDGVVWLPGKKVLNPEGQPLAGEVKGRVVYIYDDNDPVFTLKHEFFEYLLSKDKKPLMDLIAKLLAYIMYNQYKNSDELADALAKLL
jgi:hypothetical protein